MPLFVNRVQKTPKGNLPCGKFFWTKIFFQIAISQPLIGAPSRYLHLINTYIQGIQNNILHHHMATTPHTMSFQTRENVFIENFHIKRINAFFNKKTKTKIFHYKKKTFFSKNYFLCQKPILFSKILKFLVVKNRVF